MNARFAIVVPFLLAKVPAYAAIDAFIWFNDAKGIAISGPNSDKSVKITGFQFPGASEQQVHNGFSLGQRVRTEIVIQKEFDASSSNLYRAAISKRHFQIKLNFNKTVNGKSSLESTLVLTGAAIKSDKGVTVKGHKFEQLQLTYEKLKWTWTDGGKTFEDIWTK